MTTSIDTTLFVVQTGDAFGIRQGNPGEDAPEGYVSRSALKTVIRAALNAEGAPIVIAPEVAVAAGRANLELMARATKAETASGFIGMAASIFASEIDVDGAIAEINGLDAEDEEDSDF